MRRIFVSLVAAAGILAFATAAQAACNSMERPLDMAQTDSATPILPPVKQASDG